MEKTLVQKNNTGKQSSGNYPENIAQWNAERAGKWKILPGRPKI
ncbi:hypothetical protein QE403_001805 [Chryseobacterium sp. SORGH_AS 1048]|nr:hypothetical protein [Chryseobacterium sp. SORGH_AS_1048]